MAKGKSVTSAPNAARTGYKLAPMMRKGAQQKGAPKSKTT